MRLKNGYYVRDRRFRLNEDGKLYDIPVTSDKETDENAAWPGECLAWLKEAVGEASCRIDGANAVEKDEDES